MNNTCRAFLWLIPAIASLFASEYASAQTNTPTVIEHRDISVIAIDQPLVYDDGEPVAVIDTGIITRGNQVARGPHEFIFTLSSDSPYPVILAGVEVQPGGTHRIVENLTHTEGRLTVPIYPAVTGVPGNAPFTLELPEIAIQACPDGFTEDFNDCFRILYDKLLYVCPSSNTQYIEDTSDCRGVVVSPVTQYCNSPYVLQNNQCVHTYSFPAEINCPDSAGWSYNGEQCTFLDVQPVSSCPENYTLRNDSCHALVDYLYSCTDGFTLSGQQCSQFQTQPPTETCPDGLVSDSGVCLGTETVPANPVCPSGWNQSGNNCSRTDTVSASYTCPAGYTRSDTTCLLTQNQAASQSCPSGWTQSGNVCNRTDTTPVSYNCPAGWSLSGTTCSQPQTQSATASCPTNYTRSGNNCNRTLTQSAAASCPSGWTRTGTNCTTSQSQPATPGSCPGLSVRDGEQCRERDYVMASYHCNEGYPALDNRGLYGVICLGGGYQQQSFGSQDDFNPTPESLQIGSGWTEPYIWCPTGYTLDPAFNDYPRCYSDVFTPLPYSCPTGWTRSGNTCNRTQSQPVTYSCPSNYTRSGTTCSTVISTPVTYQCPTGWARSGTTCNRTATQPANSSCPSGYTRSDNSCNRTQSQSVSYSCPSGWARNGSNCSRTLTQPASSNCPSGYTQSGSLCTRTQMQPVSYSCPSGSTLIGENCEQVLTQPVVLNCPQSYSLNGNTCDRTVVNPAIQTCPNGSSALNAQSCFSVYSNPLIGTCPTGYIMNDNQGICEMTDSAPAEVYCSEQSENVTLNGTTCTFYDDTDISLLCDDGATLIDDNALCQLYIQEEAIPTCPDDRYTPIVSQSRCRWEERLPFGN